MAAVWTLLGAAPAWAAGDGERVGENIGDLLGGWSKGLYVGIGGLVALMFLLNRRFADLAIFMVAATVVGGFVVDRRIYRVDRWALPVPGGVPLRGVAYFAAALVGVVVFGGMPGIGGL